MNANWKFSLPLQKRFSIPILMFGILVILYATLIEPSWLQTNHYELFFPVKSELKLVHLSDMHLKDLGFLENKMISIINSFSPDIITITGDTLDNASGVESAKMFFKKLSPKYGIWSVLGNWEHWRGFTSASLFESFGVHLLGNESISIREDFSIVGFDPLDSTEKLQGRSTSSNPLNAFCISLFHYPENFSKLSKTCELALSGHTHGGQIRLPLLRPFWLPEGSGEFISGWYQKNNSQMYVSRGTGTSIIPGRLFARPEIVLITIRSKK